jgi:hypothetical protein
LDTVWKIDISGWYEGWNKDREAKEDQWAEKTSNPEGMVKEPDVDESYKEYDPW